MSGDNEKSAKKRIDKDRHRQREGKKKKRKEKIGKDEGNTSITSKSSNRDNAVGEGRGTAFEGNVLQVEKSYKMGDGKIKFSEGIAKAIPHRIPNISRDLKVDLLVAIPSTVINNRSDVIKSHLSSYLARVFTVFSVAKVYIYDDQLAYERVANKQDGFQQGKHIVTGGGGSDEDSRGEDARGEDARGEDARGEDARGEDASGGDTHGVSTSPSRPSPPHDYSYLCKYLHYNLQYLETPQYLRKHLFPITHFLKHSGIMNPVDAPHHLRSDEWLPFREGVVIKKVSNEIIIDVGLFSHASVENVHNVNVGTRVTVLFHRDSYEQFQKKNTHILFPAKIVHPCVPKMYNIYWGYTIEVLKNVSDVFNLGVDCVVGTSERGQPMTNARSSVRAANSILLVFGNKDGLEELLLLEDAQRKGKTYTGVEKNKVLKKILRKFDLFLNTCPHQTSRTIRTEEAITITLSLFHDMLT
ncbi:RNA methyltransferase, putative [Plasmodium ovale curtisi]|uniref:RNA methyltransferase, putative n=1 Tax=Plasmodium ovale curtisi TaxID=864141 RepID=A0A1A8W2X6_PLAOA|nr:RNA methyltransferase, putative [Plasmodium ovale curtisi]